MTRPIRLAWRRRAGPSATILNTNSSIFTAARKSIGIKGDMFGGRFKGMRTWPISMQWEMVEGENSSFLL
jgi:hypothetical protein